MEEKYDDFSILPIDKMEKLAHEYANSKDVNILKAENNTQNEENKYILKLKENLKKSIVCDANDLNETEIKNQITYNLIACKSYLLRAKNKCNKTYKKSQIQTLINEYAEICNSVEKLGDINVSKKDFSIKCLANQNCSSYILMSNNFCVLSASYLSELLNNEKYFPIKKQIITSIKDVLMYSTKINNLIL